MGGCKPTFLPYPSFQDSSPNNEKQKLSAVGRCRIYPLTCTNTDTTSKEDTEFQAILDKTIQQSQVPDDDKKLKKKCMKEGVAMAQSYLSTTLALDVSVVDVEMVLDSSMVVESDGCVVSCFLDAGCARVVLTSADDDVDKLVQGLDASRVPKERLVAHFDNCDNLFSSSTLSQSVVPLTNTISTNYNGDIKDTEACLDKIKSLTAANEDSFGNSATERITLVLQIPTNQSKTTQEELSNFVSTISKYFQNDKTTPKKLCGTTALQDPTPTQLGFSYASCIVTDRPDKLFTTVVTSRSNEALGLVYSSPESVIAALECGRGVYYSRSRNGLWRKGDTSGHYQTLHRIDVDCDGDALRFVVTQRGDEFVEPAFCHLGTFTCWGEPCGIRHLEGTLRGRLKNAPEGSYTKRLFDDSELLRDKLVEEAQELSEAESKQHVAEELADVLYFAMAKAAKAGVSIDDAISELDKRTRKVTRRKGDSKAFRIAAGDAILNKGGSS